MGKRNDGSNIRLGMIILAFFIANVSRAGEPPQQQPQGTNNHSSGNPGNPVQNSFLPNNETQPAAPFPPGANPDSLCPPSGPPPVEAPPSLQPSPSSYATSWPKTGKTGQTDNQAKLTASSKLNHDPKWMAAVKKYEEKSRLYQAKIDQLLEKHGQNWESLSKDPADRKKCDEITRQWKDDEARLEALYAQAMKAGQVPASQKAIQNPSGIKNSEGEKY